MCTLSANENTMVDMRVHLSTITICTNSAHQPTSHTSDAMESLQIYCQTMLCPKSKLEYPEKMVSLPRG
jgi:hypothetical protein